MTPGALVTANQTTPLTEIVQMDPMYVDFTQSTADLLQLRNDWASGRYQKVDGDQIPVRIQLEDGSTYDHEGKLAFSGQIVNATMGTVTLRAVVPNPDGVLLPGMFVQAQLPTGLAPEAILVPQRSVTRDLTGRAHVMVVNADGNVERRAVELGRAIGTNWLLDKGLQAGERVIVDGFQRIKPGDTVKVVEVDPNAKSGASASRGCCPACRSAAQVSTTQRAAVYGTVFYQSPHFCLGDRHRHHAGGDAFHLYLAAGAIPGYCPATRDHHGAVHGGLG